MQDSRTDSGRFSRRDFLRRAVAADGRIVIALTDGTVACVGAE